MIVRKVVMNILYFTRGIAVFVLCNISTPPPLLARPWYFAEGWNAERERTIAITEF